MKLRPLFPKETLGIRKVFGLVVMMAAVAAVAYLERSLGRDLDLRLLYFLIVLCGAILLPRLLALAVAVSVAIVSVGVSGGEGTSLVINGLTHLLMYGYAALLTNNWEQERRRLMRMSRVDELTGLHNLRALQEQLPTWLGPAARTGRRMAVLMMDVDGFKAVNDRLGHGVGNELLKELASRCGSAMNRFNSAAMSSFCCFPMPTAPDRRSSLSGSRTSTDRWVKPCAAPTSKCPSASASPCSPKMVHFQRPCSDAPTRRC